MKANKTTIAKVLVFLLCLLPTAALVIGATQGKLGANPVETITQVTGEWTLRFLLITLAITPLRKITRYHVLQKFRRMLGLFAFFYACLHFLTWMIFDHFFDSGLDWASILEDILERPYITVGFTAFLLLIPLAVTSTKGMMKRLGRNWAKLHKLVYLIAILGVLHFAWLVKADLIPPIIHGLILTVLLGFRIVQSRKLSGTATPIKV